MFGCPRHSPFHNRPSWCLLLVLGRQLNFKLGQIQFSKLTSDIDEINSRPMKTEINYNSNKILTDQSNEVVRLTVAPIDDSRQSGTGW